MRALALGVGLERIDVAFCTDKITIPLEGIIRENRNQVANEIKNLFQIHDIPLLIVGIPKGGSGGEETIRRIKYFIPLLEFDKEVRFVDESGTGKEALGCSTANAHKKDTRPDSLAALVTIKDYFGI